MIAPGGRRQPDAATVLSLALYAALCALIVITVCTALGYFERSAPSFDALPVPAYMRHSTLGFYDKSELRLVLLAMFALSTALALLFIWLAARRKRVSRLHPAHAAFAIVLYFSAVVLPPYDVDLDHWFPLVAAATAISNGVWPYFSGYDSGYGLLAPAVLAVWLKYLGLSELSLSALISACTLLAGAASFTLIRRLTGSRTVALLGAAYLLLEASGPLVVTSAFRGPVQITLGALLLYASLRADTRSAFAGFLFGVVVLWNPPFGAFAAAGYVVAHACRIWQAPAQRRLAAAIPLITMFLGLLVPLLVVQAAGRPTAIAQVFGALGSAGNLFMLGYANTAQQFNPLIVPGFILTILYAGFAYRRLARGVGLTQRYLFVGATLVGAVPWVLYALGRSDTTHYFGAWWSLMPCFALFGWGFVRLLALTRTQRSVHPPGRLSVTVLCVVFIVLFPFARFYESVANYVTRYEAAREAWYATCAGGKSCDARKKPSLANALREAAEPLALRRLAHDRGLVAACRRHLDILSYRDAWIYATGNCYTPTGMPTVNLINTKSELERHVALLAAQPQILFDPTTNIYAKWKGDMLGEIRARLLASGFAETAGCGRFSVLSRTAPDPTLAQLCD